MKKINRILALCACVFFASSLMSCSKKGGTGSNEEEAETIFAVNAYKAVPKTLDDYLEFGGNVQTASTVDIFPDAASGKISKLYVKVGDKVKKDQVVAEVDASRPGMDFQSSPVKAPVDGTITSFPLSVGATVAASVSIGKISSTGKLEVKTYVAERFVSRIKKNQKAILTFDAYPGDTFDATVVEVDPVLDSTSRTLGIKLLLKDQNDTKVRAGMYARIKLVTDTKKNTIILPSNVILTRNDEDIVYVVDQQENKVKACVVKKGIRVDDKQEIQAGIVPGDLVVIKGQALLSDGAKVKIASIQE